MDKIQKLRAEWQVEVDAAKAIRTAAEKDDRDLTDEEATKIKGHLDKAKELRGQIEAAQKRQALKADLDGELAWGEQPEPRVTRSPHPSGSMPKIVGGEGSRDFSSFGEFVAQVKQAGLSNHPDPRLIFDSDAHAGPQGLSTIVDSDGGFLIPETFRETILQRMYSQGRILSQIPAGNRGTLAGKELKIPYVDETSRATGSRWGGVRAYWVDEGGTITASAPKYGQMSLRPKKVACLGYVTEEMVEDYGAASSLLMTAFTNELIFAVENGIINGTGVGQPLGILNAAALISITKETNQTASTVQGGNVAKMWERCWAPSRETAVWLIEQSVEHFLWALTIEGGYGSATTPIPLYYPAGSIMNTGRFATLMGRPVIPNEYCKAVGTAGDIILVNFGDYLLVDKGAPNTAASIHVRFLTDEQTFRMTYRVDGQPTWASALTPFSAGSTLSPYVVTAARG